MEEESVYRHVIIINGVEYDDMTQVPDYALTIVKKDIEAELCVLDEKIKNRLKKCKVARGVLLASSGLFLASVFAPQNVSVILNSLACVGMLGSSLGSLGLLRGSGEVHERLKKAESFNLVLADEIKRRADEREIFSDLYEEKEEVKNREDESEEFYEDLM